MISLTLILDNYDSFTWNLAQAVEAITGRAPMVVRNDRISWEELQLLNPGAIIISPGPGSPRNPTDFGICSRVIAEMQCPILGVCLGHQGICLAFGARIVRAREVMHGRGSAIFHTGDALFEGVPTGFEAIRYHSLIAEAVPECLEVTASTEAGEIMAVRHRTRPLWGVQFHPESVSTQHGTVILRNFLRLADRHPPRADAAAIFRAHFSDSNYAFWLDGGTTGYSFMGDGSLVIEGPDALDIVAADLSRNHRADDPSLPFAFQGGWVGHITYEAEARFLRVDRYIAINNLTGQVWFSEAEPRGHHTCPVSAGPLHFDIAKDAYIAKTRECLELIRAGESYEICLTNQLRGTCTADPLACFEALRVANPAPFAAYLRYPDVHVASTSPELFLNVTPAGHVTSKPIKGTSRRSSAPVADQRLKQQLADDVKTRAENLMIVDLVRNDLGRVCQAGSIHVPSLMAIETFSTVHQMVSTIEGDLKPGLTALDAVQAAFPPGSMTGAPKIRTMELLRRLESGPRGIYSGCIGFLSLTGAAAFSVVIRSAVFANGEVSIGTGGAIVAQSDPEQEWDELVLKAQVLAQALGTSID